MAASLRILIRATQKRKIKNNEKIDKRYSSS